jgi:hypothetical protein
VSNAGIKHDTTKPRFTLLPWASVRHVVDVLEFGARKYAVDNWQRVADARQRYTDAALRHVIAMAEGETHDPESGLYHAAHAVCCLLFIMWFDDREGAEDVMRESAAYAMKINQPKTKARGDDNGE